MTELFQKLQQHFAAVSQDQQTPVWDQVWQAGITPWDRNAPSPALREALQESTDERGITTSPTKGKRKRALVPGCGKGYDVALLSSFCYDSYGLDVSPTAIDQARRIHSDRESIVQNYPLGDSAPESSRGAIEFLLGDFFTNDVFESLDGGAEAKFDLIYDYTFLCALPPPLRPKWANRMSELLADDGVLVCLEFPLSRDPSLPGPPHGLTPELYIEILKRPGEEVGYGEDGRVKVVEGRDEAGNALVRVKRWKAQETHQVGQGIDHISLWRHK